MGLLIDWLDWLELEFEVVCSKGLIGIDELKTGVIVLVFEDRGGIWDCIGYGVELGVVEMESGSDCWVLM